MFKVLIPTVFIVIFMLLFFSYFDITRKSSDIDIIQDQNGIQSQTGSNVETIGEYDVFFNAEVSRGSLEQQVMTLSNDTLGNNLGFIEYLKRLVTIVSQQSLFDFDDFMDEVVIELDGNTNDYTYINTLVYNLYFFLQEGNFRFTSNQCVDYLQSQENIEDVIFSYNDIIYSNFINSPYFFQAFDDVELQRKRFNDRFDDALLFSDINDFSSLANLAPAVRCDLAPIEAQPECNKLRDGLITGNYDDVREKIRDNNDDYDVDTFYILYRMGDLTKNELIQKLCN